MRSDIHGLEFDAADQRRREGFADRVLREHPGGRDGRVPMGRAKLALRLDAMGWLSSLGIIPS